MEADHRPSSASPSLSFMYYRLSTLRNVSFYLIPFLNIIYGISL